MRAHDGVGRAAGANYEIVVRGHLGEATGRWFDELKVCSEADGTHLRGWFVDQAALQGLLRHLADLGLELSVVRRLPDGD